MFNREFEYYFHCYHNKLNGIKINKDSYDQLEVLYNYLSSRFSKNDKFYKLYLKVLRGSFEDNFSEDEISYLVDWEGNSKKDLMDTFYESYPYESYIHSIEFEKFENGWYLLVLDESNILQIDPEYTDIGDDLSSLISYLLEQFKTIYDLQKEQKYIQEVISNINYNQRFGTILLKDLYEFDHEVKINIYNNITDNEVEAFSYLMNNPIDPLKRINLNMYLSACNAGYEANIPFLKQYERAKEIKSLKERYLEIADGRHDGMLDLNEDSYEEFDQWLNDTKNKIGHPFEVVTSMDISYSIHLYPYDEKDGYVFLLSCDKWPRTAEIIRFALAINSLGYPVRVRNYQKIIDRLKGKSVIGVCPDSIASYFGDSWFRNIKGYDFAVNLNYIFLNKTEEEKKSFISKVNWQEITYSKLL